jgi:hypothetical protein
MCIDNLMLKGFQLDNTCPIKKKNELNCCNNFPSINGSIKNAPKNESIKKNGSCVINKYGTHINLSELKKSVLDDLSLYVKYVNTQEIALNKVEKQKEDYKNTYFSKDIKDNSKLCNK